jgi:hypothetical protein
MHVEFNSTKQRSSVCLKKRKKKKSRQSFQTVTVVPCRTEARLNAMAVRGRQTKCSEKHHFRHACIKLSILVSEPGPLR